MLIFMAYPFRALYNPTSAVVGCSREKCIRPRPRALALEHQSSSVSERADRQRVSGSHRMTFIPALCITQFIAPEFLNVPMSYHLHISCILRASSTTALHRCCYRDLGACIRALNYIVRRLNRQDAPSEEHDPHGHLQGGIHLYNVSII